MVGEVLIKTRQGPEPELTPNHKTETPLVIGYDWGISVLNLGEAIALGKPVKSTFRWAEHMLMATVTLPFLLLGHLADAPDVSANHSHDWLNNNSQERYLLKVCWGGAMPDRVRNTQLHGAPGT